MLKFTRIASTLARRTYVKSPKFDHKKYQKNPWEELEKYKSTSQNIPSFSQGQGTTGVAYFPVDRIAQENVADLESSKKSGIVPGSEILEEEPGYQEYIDWVNLTTPKDGKWHLNARRCGAIGVKVGMFPMWTEYLERISVTCIWIPECHVIQQKTKSKEGYNSLQVGAGSKKIKNVTKPLLGHFQKAGVEPKQVLAEFKVSPDCMLPVGHEITSKHFTPGQYVDIVAYSKGKGFQGGMKRHGFRGLRATHGVSVSHRSQGSAGPSGQKMWKGKKMAGHMGQNRVRKPNNFVFMIDTFKNCVFVKGSIPGAPGTFCLLEDALKKKQAMLKTPPPFPSNFEPRNETIKGAAALLKAKNRVPEYWSGYGDKGDAMTQTPEQVDAWLKENVGKQHLRK